MSKIERYVRFRSDDLHVHFECVFVVVVFSEVFLFVYHQ